MTLEENFYQVNLSDEIIELDLNNKKEGQLSFSSSDLLTINSISYISDNPSVAAVDRNGTILAKGIGKTNIRLIINDEIERICEVIVGPYEDVLSVNIVPDEAIIYLNLSNELKLNLEIYPEEANIENVTWTSNKPQVATVENGIVKALSSGSVTIKAEVNGVSDTIEIVVKNPSSAVVLNINEKILKVNETFNLIPNYPENLYHPTVSWISTNENVATVSDGLVTAHSNGLAEIILNVNNDEYISRAFIYVVDPTVLIDLDIDASGGTYQDSKIYKYKENSLNTITLIKPLYKVNVELDYGNVLEKKTFEVTHDFIGWSNYGDGVLNNNTYKFGFANSKLVANWKYNSLVLPDLSNIESDKIFVGWYKDPNYKEFIGKNISYIPLSNQTLYAYWASYKKADINDDALIDITDLVILRQYLAEIVLQDKINVLAADINEDGNVDITDLIILRKYLAGLEEIN
ncbi:MAG: Ig-like domain-containing protein [Bacilli bacterium]|nr:Ig-like domain-containing protein [Bacilli bacterium]